MSEVEKLISYDKWSEKYLNIDDWQIDFYKIFKSKNLNLVKHSLCVKWEYIFIYLFLFIYVSKKR